MNEFNDYTPHLLLLITLGVGIRSMFSRESKLNRYEEALEEIATKPWDCDNTNAMRFVLIAKNALLTPEEREERKRNLPNARRASKLKKLLLMITKRIFDPRGFWEDRAESLPVDPERWRVGRTDMMSFDIYGRYIHYAYPPEVENRERIPCRSLRGAVLIAEGMNAYLDKKT